MRLRRGDKILLASHNQGKVKELEALLRPYGVMVVGANDVALPEPEETEDSFAGNALLKARHGAAHAGLPCLADDSGFCVTGLGGQPGIFSARWAGEKRDFTTAMEKIHLLLGDHPDRSAWFICVLALVWPDGQEAVFEGRVDGAVIWPPRGTNGFGYDPIFIPNGGTRSFGEIVPAEKDAISHRARAFAAFAAASLEAP